MANTTLQLAQAATQAPADAPQAPAEGAAPADAHANPTEGTHTGTEVPSEEHGSFPPFDSATFPSQILWLAISFGLLYLLLSRLALPRVGGIIHERQHRIFNDIAEANRLKSESEAAAAAYEQELAEARNNAGAIAQKARDAAKADADAKRADAEAAVNGRIADAERQIAASKGKAMKEVGSIATETAEAIVRSLVGASVTKADIEKAVRAELAK